jgi:hypothetical protein
MGKVKDKIVTLDEQITFFKTAVNHIREMDSQIVLTKEHVDLLVCVLDNLNTTKMWLMLPELHQAAMYSLDEAYDAHVTLRANGLTFNSAFDILVHILSVVRKINNNTPDKENVASLQWVSAMALIGVSQFVIPVKGTNFSPDRISKKLAELKAWFSRIQTDVVADDYLEVRNKITAEVMELHRNNPGLLTKEDLVFFKIIVKKEVNNG